LIYYHSSSRWRRCDSWRRCCGSGCGRRVCCYARYNVCSAGQIRTASAKSIIYYANISLTAIRAVATALGADRMAFGDSATRGPGWTGTVRTTCVSYVDAVSVRAAFSIVEAAATSSLFVLVVKTFLREQKRTTYQHNTHILHCKFAFLLVLDSGLESMVS
jgi:hypothetical protein